MPSWPLRRSRQAGLAWSRCFAGRRAASPGPLGLAAPLAARLAPVGPLRGWLVAPLAGQLPASLAELLVAPPELPALAAPLALSERLVGRPERWGSVRSCICKADIRLINMNSIRMVYFNCELLLCWNCIS